MLFRRNLTIAVVWLTLCGAAFLHVFSIDGVADHVAVFVVGLVVLQLPAFLAVVEAPEGRPLETGRAITVGVMGAFAGAYSGFALLDNLSPETGLGITLLLFLGIAAALTLLLASVPHPHGGRIAFTLMVALSLFAVGTTLALSSHVAPELYLVISCGIPWPVPLLLLCWWPRPSIAPVVRVVR